ncbi:MAG: type IIA DNA topoisomerase subunit B [Lentisphaerae bacterium]|jgi:topoisomerase IV subunit B|nr:type IIA DNA topoisomerase subunit B [Lentisphaerota bacterium]MBT5610057.1 type IIA DNA topoisomerase subunit B [Lentisphaerota bacterium]MBT7055543.1 type IIA DNA topoisomerase subunit B [Lentisphaerota bacterium]MBT7841502.1 type IIA DNA topoisomerase subunit B [Lentisphaerota bacterium]
MSKTSTPVYDESKVKTLSSLEHIRTRPGMYVGRLGKGSHQDDGIYVLLKEVIDNCIDEFIMGFGKRVDISVSEGGEVRVRDYGRGIPLGKLIDCVSRINTGAKYNDEVFQFSVGLNGVGLKAVNALAESFRVTSHRDGATKTALFADGNLQDEGDGTTEEPDGTEIVFRPGPDFFPHFQFEEKIVRRRLWNYAYLNSGLSFYYNGERYYSRHGVLDLLEEKVEGEKVYEIIYHKEAQLEFAFCHTPNFGETYYSFVNGQYTNDGGTHQSAFREGILKAVNDFSGKNLDGADVRNGIVGAIAVKLREPIFESQTKNKLGNHEIRTDLVNRVRDIVAAFLYKNDDTAAKFLEKVTQNERLRKEIQTVKKQAKEQAKKARIKIPKLRDCKYHLSDSSAEGSRSMLFLTEGQSAAGSMISCRDVNTQAIFCLKGKPLNCHGHRWKTVYKNEELYFVMKSLGIEDGLESLRYAKVIIATDADVDGLHIRNLLITFFLTYFEQLVLSQHLFILETPLFRVRNKKQTIYCYDEQEREEAAAKLGKSIETTRFKGLGEISPGEFGQFIGDDIRLVPVTVDSLKSVPTMLDFFMGKNTPQRRSYIMENLI